TLPQYVAFDPGAGPGGLLQSHTPSMPALAYLYTADVQAKLAEIEVAGGKRMGEPMRMPGAGCFGYFKDPSGTSMGLIVQKGRSGRDGRRTRGYRITISTSFSRPWRTCHADSSTGARDDGTDLFFVQRNDRREGKGRGNGVGPDAGHLVQRSNP